MKKSNKKIGSKSTAKAKPKASSKVQRIVRQRCSPEEIDGQLAVCANLLTQGYSYSEVVDLVSKAKGKGKGKGKEHEHGQGISRHVAIKRMQDLSRRWQEAESGVTKAHHITIQRRRVMVLYRLCLDSGDLSVAARLEVLMAKMNGAFAPERHIVAVAAVEEIKSDSFDERSEVDLEYYLKNGFFPEEAPEGVAIETTGEPVDEFPALH